MPDFLHDAFLVVVLILAGAGFGALFQRWFPELSKWGTIRLTLWPRKK